MLGINGKSTVNEWIRAKKSFPNETVLVIIANIFAVSVEWLVGRIDKPYDDTSKKIYKKYPELLDDGPSYLTEEEGLEALSDMFQMDVPDDLLENKAAWNELKRKNSALRDRLKKEFPKLDSLYLSYRHVAYI